MTEEETEEIFPAPVLAPSPKSLSYFDVDYAAWRPVPGKRDQHGNMIVYFQNPMGVRLWAPDQVPQTLEVVFPVDPNHRGNFDRPSSEPPNSLDVCLRIPPNLQEWLERLETHMQQQMALNSQAWFAKQMPLEVVQKLYTNLIKSSGQYPPHLKTRLVLSGSGGNPPTTVKILGPDRTLVAQGSGMDFVLAHQGEGRWRRALARAVVVPQKIMYSRVKIFFSLRLTHLEIQEAPEAEPDDPFA